MIVLDFNVTKSSILMVASTFPSINISAGIESNSSLQGTLAKNKNSYTIFNIELEPSKGDITNPSHKYLNRHEPRGTPRGEI